MCGNSGTENARSAQEVAPGIDEKRKIIRLK